MLGMRSLFGHTVGGAAGAVSRITGAMGKGIAVLTFDKEYQKKRLDQIKRPATTVHEGFARGGKGLVMVSLSSNSSSSALLDISSPIFYFFKYIGMA